MTRYQPLWLQQGNYPAGTDRAVLGALWPAGGVSGMAVTAAAAMTLNIAPGRAAVPTATNTGSTLCWSDAVEQVTLAAAPPSGQNRIDVVTVMPRGNDLDGGANNDWIFNVVPGTAAPSPTVPVVPAGQLAVAQVAVTGGTASVSGANITDRRGGGLSVVNARFHAWRTTSPYTLALDGVNPPLPWDQADDPYKMLNLATGVLTCPFTGALAVSWGVLITTTPAVVNPNVGSFLTSPVGTTIRRGSFYQPSASTSFPSWLSVGSAIVAVTAGQTLEIQPYANAAGATKQVLTDPSGATFWDAAYLST